MDDYLDQKFNFASIGFDSSGDIEFASAYTLRGFLLVDSVDGDEIVGIVEAVPLTLKTLQS